MRTDIITTRDLDTRGVPMLPEQYSYIMSQPYIRHQTPTTDPGFYHRHQIHAEKHWDMKLAIDKFKREFDAIPGALILSNTKPVHTPGCGPFTNTLDVFYAVIGPAPAAAKDSRIAGAVLFPYR